MRRCAECEGRRGDAGALWMRLRFPVHDDTFGTTGWFSGDAIRLPTSGYTYLELAGVMGNSADRKHIYALRGDDHARCLPMPMVYAPLGGIPRCLCSVYRTGARFPPNKKNLVLCSRSIPPYRLLVGRSK